MKKTTQLNMDEMELQSLSKKKHIVTQFMPLNEQDNNIDDETSWVPFLRQLLISTGAWTVPFVSGLSMAATSIVVDQLRREAKSKDAVSVEMSSWLTICAFSSSIFWAILFTILMKHIGRKKPYLMASTTMLIGFITMFCSSTFTHLLIGEFLKGSGFASNLTITVFIVTEYTSPKYRGVFLAIKGSSIVCGVWVAIIIGKFFHWKYIPFTALVCFIFNVTLVFWPESPVWLATQGEFRKCMASHRWLKGIGSEAERELKELLEAQKEKRTKQDEQSNTVKHISMKSQILQLYNTVLKPQFYKPMFMVNLILLIDIASGSLMCSMYGVEIMNKIAKDQSRAYNLLIIGDSFVAVGMYCGFALVNKINRRTIMIGASASLVGFLLMFSLYFYFVEAYNLRENFIITAVLVAGHRYSFGFGPLILCFALYAELTPLESRTSFSILCFTSLTLVNSVYLKIVPYIFNALSLHSLFFCYTLSASIVTILFCKFLPETKDKTLVEIQAIFEN